MSNNYFQFKKFKIFQEKSAMKVGTDGVLLGAYTNPQHAKSILDIGAGTGLISMMLVQKTKAKITAIEIDENSFHECCNNVAINGMSEQIKVIHSSVQNFQKQTKQKFDLIVSNPPYFENALKNPDESRATARHNEQLSYLDLIDSVKKLLETDGLFLLILPADSFDKFEMIANENKLFCNEKLLIYPTPNKLVTRIIACFSLKQSKVNISKLTIETGIRHEYTDEYVELTKDYYLKF